MKVITIITAVFLLNVAFSNIAYADIAIIVNKNSTLELTFAQIRDVFMGKLKATDTNEAIAAFDFLDEETDVREEFLQKVLNKKASHYNAHWARIIFSSEGRPPKKVRDGGEMLSAVATNKNGIGYIKLADADDSVRVLFVVK